MLQTSQPILFRILGTLALMVLLPLGAEASSDADRVLPVEMNTAGERTMAVDPLLKKAYLKVSNTDGVDQDGGSVGVSADTGVVGARGADDDAIWVNAGGGNNDLLGCNTPPPVAEKLTAEYYVPEPSTALKQIRVDPPAANEQVIWILTGAPAGSTVFDNTGAQEFGAGTVNSEFRITGGTNGNRLTMRGDANNGNVLGTWTFDAKLKNTTSNCESTAITGFTVTADEPSVGGTLSGLEGDQVVLQNNGGDDQVLTADGGFTFSPQDNGTDYDVTVLTQPSGPSQTCTVLNGTGTLAGADVTNVEVNCTTDQFSVGGSVSGLEGDQVVLQNNGGDDQVLTADGGFTFAPQDDGTNYDVTVLIQPSNPSQTCSVSNGSGTLAGADVTNVEITCSTDQFSVGGSVSGLEGDQVVLQNNGGDDQVLTADGGFTFAPQDDGTGYDVTVATQPSDPSQTCAVSNGSGTLAGADVTDVEVNCTTDPFSVGGTVSGLEGDQVVLQNNGGDDQVLTADGGFTFAPQDDGTGYDVTVATQPSDPSQTCSVGNGTGTVDADDVSDVEVDCITDPSEITLLTTTIDFGTLAFGDSGTASVLVESTGSNDLVLDAITNPGEPFVIAGGSCTDLPVTLAPGESCQIGVEFTPTPAGGAASASFEIQTNAESSPDTVYLQAAGQPVPVPALNRLGLLFLIALMVAMAVRATLLRSKA